MKVRGTSCIACAVLIAGGISARAQTVSFFDLELQPVAASLTTLPLAGTGVTLTLSRGGQTFAVVDLSASSGTVPFGARTLAPNVASGTAPFTINFSAPVTSFAAQLGDFGDDADLLTLTAFSLADAGGAAVASDTRMLVPVGTSFSFDTLEVNAALIRSVQISGGVGDNSVFLDNLSATVPEPGFAGLCVAGGAIALRRRSCRIR